MQKNEYIARLSYALARLSYIERQEILKEIEDHFDEGMAGGQSEQDISERLGTPEELAAKYLESAGIPASEEPAAKTSVVENTANMVLGIFGLFFGIPVISVLFGLLCGAFGASVGMMTGGSVVIALASTFTGMAFAGMLAIGIGVCVMGIGALLLGIGAIKYMVRGIKWYISAVCNLFKHGRISEVANS